MLALAPKAMWYVTRGSGTVSLLLLTTSVVLGVSTVVRWATVRWPRLVVEGLHRNVSLLAVAFLGAHIATAVIDGFVPIRWLDVVVPFGSAYQPLWLGFGALAFDLLIAVILTSLLRVRFGQHSWRAVHWLVYACWPIAVVHGLGIGSDGGQPWMMSVDLAAIAGVAGAIAWRLSAGPTSPGVGMGIADAGGCVPVSDLGKQRP
ncbi:MAG: ferric reductase-like transmembrane domain-containing protein [Actinomycetota bacterium]|nr:ferric reductase-like transmembrane domain-containing protein [Actinomycetota bacterium]